MTSDIAEGGGYHATFLWLAMVVSLCGLTFNATVLYLGVTLPHLRRDNSTLFQLLLAVIDFSTTSMMFVLISETLIDGEFDWDDAACTRFGVATVILFGLSITVLCLIGLDRYSLLVRLRRLNQKAARLFLLVCSPVVLLIAFLPVMGLGQYKARPGLAFCMVDWQADDAGGLLFAGLVLLMVGGSAAWVGHAYWKMFAAVRQALRMRLAITQSSTIYAKEVRTARRLFIMAACYVAAWAPLSLSVMYELMWRRHTSVNLDMCVYVLGFTNCAVNPVLLVVMHVRFRRAFASLAADVLVALGCSKKAQTVVVWRNDQLGSRMVSSAQPNSDIRHSALYSSFADQNINDVIRAAAGVNAPGSGRGKKGGTSALRGHRLVQIMPLSMPPVDSVPEGAGSSSSSSSH